MSGRVQQFSKRLAQAFSGQDHFTSHERAATVLAEMASDPTVLHDILELNLRSPDFFERHRIDPVLALPIGRHRSYSLIGHCWLPLDDARTDLTYQSVRHHGKLLFTSMSAWGKGYESVLFKSGFRVTSADGATEMEIDKIYQNPRGHLQFVGTDTPHVVFFPPELTVTYALWSRDRRPPLTTALLQRILGIRACKKSLKSGLQRLGMASGLGLNVVEKLDFFPQEGKLLQMKDRIHYAPGSRENFTQNFFWMLQQLKFDRLGAVADRIRQAGGHAQAANLLKMLETDFPIARRMEPCHLGVARAQFSRRELLACFPSHAGTSSITAAHQAG